MLCLWHHLWLLLSTLIFDAVFAIDPIVIKGKKFFYSNNGSEFAVRAIRYQDANRVPFNSASFKDPLLDEVACSRDIPHLLKLGINTLYIDAYNSVSDHSECMDSLQNSGIYVIVVVNGQTIVNFRANNNLKVPIDYTLADQARKNIDFFQKYNNTIGFVVRVGHGVAQLPGGQIMGMTPFYKALVRDAKEYIRAKGYRSIPVGSSGYGEDWATPTAQYMMCGEDEVAIDFYRIYTADYTSWCLNSSASLLRMRDMYESFQRPMLLSHGCNQSISRTWDEVWDIYNPPMSNVFAGAMIQEWFNNVNPDNEDKGLVEITANGANVKYRPAYSALSSQFALITPPSTLMAEYDPKVTPIFCKDHHQADSNIKQLFAVSKTIPTRFSPRLCNCMMQTLECVTKPGSSQGQLEQMMDPMMKDCNTSSSEPHCLGIWKDTSVGRFDSFAFCNFTEQGSWALQKFQETVSMDNSTNSTKAERCSSAGGVIREPTTLASLPSDCQNLLHQAGPAGTGTITSFPPVATGTELSMTTTSSSELSKFVKAGIGLGIAVFMALLLTIIAVCVRIGRSNSAKKKVASESLEAYQKAELPDSAISPTELSGAATIQEMSPSTTSPATELAAEATVISEAAGDDGAVELPTPYNRITEIPESQSHEPVQKREPKI